MELTPVLEPLKASPTGVRNNRAHTIVDTLLGGLFGAVEFEAPTDTAGGIRHSGTKYLRRVRPGYRLTVEAIGPITRIEGRYRKWQAYIVQEMKESA